ncbi:MAG: nucleoside triphosphate pyrophosphohydrolase family protein [Chloroflexota bacterium]|nr:nucleoside triphosphate pyrophosphohydrolase family protein [Chloroflexota bacterium]
MQDQLRKLEQFHETFQCYINYEPAATLPEDVQAVRVRLFEEELGEYRSAIGSGDIVEVADALTDMLYVLLGTFVAHGLQDLAGALFDEVHRSNMSKLDAAGQPVFRDDGKVLKSDLFEAPDLASILRNGRDEVIGE